MEYFHVTFLCSCRNHRGDSRRPQHNPARSADFLLRSRRDDCNSFMLLRSVLLRWFSMHLHQRQLLMPLRMLWERLLQVSR